MVKFNGLANRLRPLDAAMLALLRKVDKTFALVEGQRYTERVSARRFSSIVVAANGQMARMNTVHPLAFVRFQRWLAQRPDRDPLKVDRDALQASTVAQWVQEYLLQLLPASA